MRKEFKINCPMCKSFVKEFFTHAISLTVREADKLIMSCGEHPEKCKHTREALEKIQDKKVTEIRHGYYTRAANNWDVGKLMRLKAFADLLDNNLGDKDYSELDEKLADNRMDFWKHEAVKIAKHIDHLEECLAKSKG